MLERLRGPLRAYRCCLLACETLAPACMLWIGARTAGLGGRASNGGGVGLRTVLTLLSAVYLLWITADARTLRRGWSRMPVNSG